MKKRTFGRSVIRTNLAISATHFRVLHPCLYELSDAQCLTPNADDQHSILRPSRLHARALTCVVIPAKQPPIYSGGARAGPNAPSVRRAGSRLSRPTAALRA